MYVLKFKKNSKLEQSGFLLKFYVGELGIFAEGF
jgi:hypothetical protein